MNHLNAKGEVRKMRLKYFVAAALAAALAAGGCAGVKQSVFESNKIIAQQTTVATTSLKACREGEAGSCDQLRSALEEISKNSAVITNILVKEDLEP